MESLLKDGYFDDLYGNCSQLIDISYVREYFLVKNIRVTIDKEIKYRLINLNNNFKNHSLKIRAMFLKSKADIDTNLSYLLNNFDFPRSRFSKYERALDSMLK